MEDQSVSNDMPTRVRILASARKNFLAFGFQAASIRKIASDAGFTPGALYGYFGSKEELFYALTDPPVSRIMEKLNDIESEIMTLPPDKRLLGMNGVFYSQIPELVDLIFADREIVNLVVNGSKGTKYENFLAELVGRNAHVICEAAVSAGEKNIRMVDELTLEILMEGYIATLFHLITSRRDKQTVIRCMGLFGKIYEVGMLDLIRRKDEPDLL